MGRPQRSSDIIRQLFVFCDMNQHHLSWKWHLNNIQMHVNTANSLSSVGPCLEQLRAQIQTLRDLLSQTTNALRATPNAGFVPYVDAYSPAVTGFAALPYCVPWSIVEPLVRAWLNEEPGISREPPPDAGRFEARLGVSPTLCVLQLQPSMVSSSSVTYTTTFTAADYAELKDLLEPALELGQVSYLNLYFVT